MVLWLWEALLHSKDPRDLLDGCIEAPTLWACSPSLLWPQCPFTSGWTQCSGSTWGGLVLQGTCGIIWRHLWLSKLGRYYWHPVGWSRGRCYIPYDMQDSSPQPRISQPQMPVLGRRGPPDRDDFTRRWPDGQGIGLLQALGKRFFAHEADERCSTDVQPWSRSLRGYEERAARPLMLSAFLPVPSPSRNSGGSWTCLQTQCCRTVTLDKLLNLSKPLRNGITLVFFRIMKEDKPSHVGLDGGWRRRGTQ